MLGWTCPVCHAGVAPDVQRCEHGGGAAGLGACTLCGAVYSGFHACSTTKGATFTGPIALDPGAVVFGVGAGVVVTIGEASAAA